MFLEAFVAVAAQALSCRSCEALFSFISADILPFRHWAYLCSFLQLYRTPSKTRNFPEKGRLLHLCLWVGWHLTWSLFLKSLWRESVAYTLTKLTKLCCFVLFIFLNVPFIALYFSFYHCKFTVQALLLTCRRAPRSSRGFFCTVFSSANYFGFSQLAWTICSP